MASTRTKCAAASVLSTEEAEAPRVGRLAGRNATGQILVDFPGNPRGDPVVARSAINLPAGRERGPDARPVLLIFEDGDPALPIVVGVLRESPAGTVDLEDLVPWGDRTRDLTVDRRRLVIEAQEEIVLRCGEGSIILRKDGKIIIKGKELVSRATGTNRIRGASVKIN